MTRKIKAFIFDCDGTLVDSERAHLQAWQEVANKHNQVLPEHELLTFIGKSDVEVAKMLAGRITGIDAELLLKSKNRAFFEHLKFGLPPIEGTVQFLKRVIEKRTDLGLKIAVASASNRHDIYSNLKNLGLEKDFDTVISGQDDLDEYEDIEGVNKPKPYIYLKTAKLLGVDPSECIAIEDSYSGVRSAVTAGCITIAVPNASSKSHDLSSAAHVFETLGNFSVEELIKIARKMNFPGLRN